SGWRGGCRMCSSARGPPWDPPPARGKSSPGIGPPVPRRVRGGGPAFRVVSGDRHSCVGFVPAMVGGVLGTCGGGVPATGVGLVPANCAGRVPASSSCSRHDPHDFKWVSNCSVARFERACLTYSCSMISYGSWLLMVLGPPGGIRATFDGSRSSMDEHSARRKRSSPSLFSNRDDRMAGPL